MRRWDEAIRALVLIRVGQMLGSDSTAARAVADFVDAVLAAIHG